VEWRQGLSDTVRVWSGSLVFAEYSFPFQSKTKDRNMLENTLVLYEICAMFHSKFRESSIFSSFLSLLKVFSSNGLVKISANSFLVFT
jgi:hypothetical protein